MQVQSLGREAPLEEGMGTHSSILAWRSSWTRNHGVAKSRTRLKQLRCPSTDEWIKKFGTYTQWNITQP